MVNGRGKKKVPPHKLVFLPFLYSLLFFFDLSFDHLCLFWETVHNCDTSEIIESVTIQCIL